jgi:hypothetical protein
LSLAELLRLTPPHPETAWQIFLAYALGILSGPVSWLMKLESTQALLIASLVNSVLWGVTFGAVMYGFFRWRKMAV